MGAVMPVPARSGPSGLESAVRRRARARQARWLVAHLPAFRLERFGYGADDVAALIDEERSATRLVALTPAASSQGLYRGMTVAEARALVGELTLERVEPADEATDRAALGRALDDLCDRVQARPDDLLILEIAGTSRMHGGEEAMMARVRERLAAFGHRCVIAVADHPLAAAALARAVGRDVRVPPGEGAQALASLPLTALGPSDGLLRALQTLGLSTVGAWAALDPASVAGRFGEEGARLHRVARGRAAPAVAAPAGLDPADVPPPPLHLSLDHELSRVDRILQVVEQALVQLRDERIPEDRAVATLEVRLELTHGAPTRLRLRPGRPTRRPSDLVEQVRRRLERTRLSAPVSGVVLWVRELVEVADGQVDLLERREAHEPLPELLTRLVDVLGDEAVLRAVPEDTWRPEDAWRPLSATERPEPAVDRAARDADDPVAWQEAHRWNAPRPRPTLLLHPPQPIRIDVDGADTPAREVRWGPGGRPRGWRRPRGWVQLVRAEGPERLEGAWWSAEGAFRRDYWVVDTGDGTAWVFHERGRWYLHGWFD